MPRHDRAGRRARATTSTTGARRVVEAAEEPTIECDNARRESRSKPGAVSAKAKTTLEGAREGSRDEAAEKLAGSWPLEAHSLPPRNIDPRNLRLGVYRGGRRPIDMYYRFMPESMPCRCRASAGPAVTNEEMWHVVDYVLSLPYEAGGELGADRTMAAV